MRISKHNVLIAMAKAEVNIKKLGERIGMKPQNLSAILSRGSCRPETAKKIAAGLGVDVKEIIKEE